VWWAAAILPAGTLHGPCRDVIYSGAGLRAQAAASAGNSRQQQAQQQQRSALRRCVLIKLLVAAVGYLKSKGYLG
jgi:hypothetical protein